MRKLLIFKVYCASATVVGSLLLCLCIILGYDLRLILLEGAISLALSLPSFMALQLVFMLLHSYRFPASLAWILVLALVPLLSVPTAFFLAGDMPGKVPVLAGMALAGSYAGLLFHGISINRSFQNFYYET